MTESDDTGRRKGSASNGSQPYPELPPGVPPPPEIDGEGEAKFLRDHANLLAGFDYLDEDTATAHLDPELAAEMRHEALQQEIARWSHATQNSINARREQKRAAAGELATDIAAIDGEIAARRADVEQHDTDSAAHGSASDRFEDGLPAVWLLAPLTLSILEYPVVNPAVGQLFNVTGRAQMLATVAIVIGQIVVYEVAGATAQTWRVSRGTITERRAVAAAMVASFVFTALFVTGLTLVRLEQLAESGRFTAVLLLVGVQASFALLSIISGWKASSPEAAARRRLTREIERLKDEREALEEDRSATVQEVDYLDGLLGTWNGWIEKHREGTRAEYLGQLHSFRAYFKSELAKHGRKESIYWLQHVPMPAFAIPRDRSER